MNRRAYWVWNLLAAGVPGVGAYLIVADPVTPGVLFGLLVLIVVGISFSRVALRFAARGRMATVLLYVYVFLLAAWAAAVVELVSSG